ncbi:unnamed protein product, partial [marine sediment metagenome]
SGCFFTEFRNPCWSDTFDAVSWTTNAIKKNDVS